MKVLLREARQSDLPLMLAWRNLPQIYQESARQKGPLKWDDHYNWWKTRRNRKDWIMVLNDGECSRPVGSARLDRLDSDKPEIGVYVGETTAWGRGIGTQAVKRLLEWLRGAGYKHALARVFLDNEASVRMFSSLGFKPVSLEENVGLYDLEL